MYGTHGMRSFIVLISSQETIALLTLVQFFFYCHHSRIGSFAITTTEQQTTVPFEQKEICCLYCSRVWIAGQFCLATQMPFVPSAYSHSSPKDNAEKTPSFNEVPHIDSGRKHGDKCAYSDGSRGTCADITNCRTIKKRLDASKPITFCTNRTVVCCPQQLISPIERDLEACAQHYSHLRQERHAKSMDDDSLDKQSPHLVRMLQYIPSIDILALESCL